MKTIIINVLAASAKAHSIFQVLNNPYLTSITPTLTYNQKLSVNGAEQPQLTYLRAPSQPNPVYNVNDVQLACGISGTKSDKILPIKAGDKIGAWWGHVIGGAQRAGDPDHPIAASHKGPISTYMARVDNAATSSPSGLKWFKITEDALNTQTGKWGVDNMIANKGWSYATIPTCLAGGQYLLRQELLALHSAYGSMGAQFYQSCAQLNVSSGGSFVPAQTVSIPGAYQQNDPSILIQIWVNGVPDNGRKPYLAPGPRPMSCP
ncbi:glycosyl hydrolase family 61-domain-containing protein [Apodospora peruviana]|uniref:lytic cellulose monooxygenase (C4-dehydrogenating) n=1 Tax=Apodospora peruviana TaxID=516989 RepID=A0AAE0HXB7_9PEZI|nr:glycosyl hydrolase family 61-domain-containing protein [Apodospora peruviana]